MDPAASGDHNNHTNQSCSKIRAESGYEFIINIIIKSVK